MIPSHRKQDSDTEEVFKLHLLQEESICWLCGKRLMAELFSTRTDEDTDMEWNNIKTCNGFNVIKLFGLPNKTNYIVFTFKTLSNFKSTYLWRLIY